MQLVRPLFLGHGRKNFSFNLLERRQAAVLLFFNLDDMQAKLTANRGGNLAGSKGERRVLKRLYGSAALEPAKLAARPCGIGTVMRIGHGSKAFSGLKFGFNGGGLFLRFFHIGLRGIFSQRHKNVGGLHFFLLFETGGIVCIPFFGSGGTDATSLHKILRAYKHVRNIRPGRNGKLRLVAFIIGLHLFIRRLDGSGKIRGRDKNIVHITLFAQKFKPLLGFGGVNPGGGRYHGKNLLTQQIARHILLELGRSHALGSKNAGIDLGVKLPLFVLEALDVAHGHAQFQRGDAHARAGRFLRQQHLGNKVTQNLATQLLLLQLLAGQAGIATQQVFLCVAVGQLKLPHGDGVAVDHGHKRTRTAVVEVANAPENKDKDDKTKGQFDTQGLRFVANILKHANSDCVIALDVERHHMRNPAETQERSWLILTCCCAALWRHLRPCVRQEQARWRPAFCPGRHTPAIPARRPARGPPARLSDAKLADAVLQRRARNTEHIRRAARTGQLAAAKTQGFFYMRSLIVLKRKKAGRGFLPGGGRHRGTVCGITRNNAGRRRCGSGRRCSGRAFPQVQGFIHKTAGYLPVQGLEQKAAHHIAQFAYIPRPDVFLQDVKAGAGEFRTLWKTA